MWMLIHMIIITNISTRINGVERLVIANG